MGPLTMSSRALLMLREQPASLVAGFVMFCRHGWCGDGQFGLSLISVAMYSLHRVDHTGGSSFRFITQAAGTRRKQNDTTKDPVPRATATEFLLMTRNTQIKRSYYHLHRCVFTLAGRLTMKTTGSANNSGSTGQPRCLCNSNGCPVCHVVLQALDWEERHRGLGAKQRVDNHQNQ